MARTQSQAEFDALMVKNKKTFNANLGKKNPYAQLDVDVGPYLGRIIGADRELANQKVYDATGRATGQTEKIPRVKFQAMLMASNDPKCTPTPEARGACYGACAFINYNLPPNDDEAMTRLIGTLEDMGVNTNLMILSEADRTSPDQSLLSEVLDLINAEKPFAAFEVTKGSQNDSSRFVNFRGRCTQAAVEGLLERSLDDIVDETSNEYAPVEEAPPFDNSTETETSSQTTEEVEEWIEHPSGLWLHTPTGKYFDDQGNEQADPNPPAPTPPVRKAPPKPSSAALQASHPARPTPSTPAGPAARKAFPPR